MKLKHARQILSGELRVMGWEGLVLSGKYGGDYTTVILSKKELQFCLRQLALKVTREKEKGK